MRLIFGLIGLVLAGAGFGQLSNVSYRAKLVLEKGAAHCLSPKYHHA